MSDAITLTECPTRSIASITVFHDAEAVRGALQAEFSLTPPATPGFVQSADMRVSCLAHMRFLASGPRDANLAAKLGKILKGQAAITDQSDLWVYLALSGPGAAEKLARLVPIDLAPAKFPPLALALTRAGHFDIRLWHIANQSYELAVSRTYASDLRHALA